MGIIHPLTLVYKTGKFSISRLGVCAGPTVVVPGRTALGYRNRQGYKGIACDDCLRRAYALKVKILLL